MPWLRITVTLFLLLPAACSNDRKPSAMLIVFVDENCVKRRFTQVDGQSITVSTYETDGGLTPVASFDTLGEATKAYPVATASSHCPDLTVTVDDMKSHRPFPFNTSDAGSDTSQ
jgi:hypothetical protein